MRDTEALVGAVLTAVAPGRGTLLTPDGRAIDATPPFDRLTVREAFRRFAAVDDATHLSPSRFFELYAERVEPGLAALPRATFLTEWPLAEAALARPCAHDPSVAERFELYAGGVELCNGFGELTDAAEQRRRFEAELDARRARGARLYPLDERFLSSLAEGMPRSAGNALGVDRVVALALGAPRIADVMAFSAARV
jgi:lysyl-tRNA synthetase class 2